MPTTTDCAFCAIAATSPPTPSPPPHSTPGTSHIVLSTPHVLAFLDILPLAPAHLLVIPRTHAERLTELSPTESAHVGAWLPIVARAACRVSGFADFNVVQNNGINARQVVPHVHYHIIPRPDGREREAMEREEGEERRGFRSQFGCGWRAELDDEVGGVLAERVREEIKREVVRAGEEDGRVLGKL